MTDQADQGSDPRADLLLFEYLILKPDNELDLEQAALLVAETEYGSLDVAAFMAKLDALASDTKAWLAGRPRARSTAPIAAVLEFLYGERGFHGNTSDYYDPRNSFLNDVLDRRTGIPISLGLVLVAVCRRLGIDARGVCFPGHFLVRARGVGGAPVFVDPFEGKVLDRAALRALYHEATGDPGEIERDCLEPAPRRPILVRLLNNLRAIYEVRGDQERLKRVLERLAILNPSNEIQSQLALLIENGPVPPRLSVN